MTDTETGSEVQHVRGEVLPTGSALATMREYVAGLPIESTEDVQERILRQVLTATTVETIARAGAAVPAEQVLNVPMVVTDIRPDESSFADGLGFYLHIVARLTNGDEVTVSTGSQDVCVKLIRLHQLGLLPVGLTIWRSDHATRDGFYPMFANIAPVDAF